ncbi:hypothetical protein UK12_23000 [Saccharothrix sp. ST-888]|nr:hypothetical protein UK12_23000 [Saccharothrix sp. ST-888]
MFEVIDRPPDRRQRRPRHGTPAGGRLATGLGLRPAMWLLTARVPPAALILWYSPVRRHRDLPTEPMTAPDASALGATAVAAARA